MKGEESQPITLADGRRPFAVRRPTRTLTVRTGFRCALPRSAEPLQSRPPRSEYATRQRAFNEASSPGPSGVVSR